MPFREVSLMDKEREFVEFARRRGGERSGALSAFRDQPTTGYKLLERYRERWQNQVGLVRERFFTPRLAVQELTSTAAGSVRIQELDGSPTGRGCG